MIKSVNIKNFKSLNNLHIPELTQITLISGKNNIGKTNLLEALFLFHNRINPTNLLNLVNLRGIVQAQSNPDFIFAPLFTNFDTNNTINISLRKDLPETLTIKLNPEYIPKSSSAMNLGNYDNSFKSGFTISKSSALDFTYERSGKKKEFFHSYFEPSGLVLSIDYASSPQEVVTFMASRMRSHPNEDAFKYGQLDIKGKQEIILKTLQILEPRLKSISPVAIGDTTIIYGDIGLGRKMPLNYFGDGLSRLLSISLSIANSENGIALIDEIENGLHYSVMQNLWKGISSIAQEVNCQIIATTHSYECICSAYRGLGSVSEFSFTRLDRGKNNEIVSNSFDSEMLKTAFEEDWEVR